MNLEKPLNNKTNYLIIGGTTKAATTSLFFYLSEHPQICAANMKETRFFLDADYPVPSKYRYEDGLNKYEEFFGHCASDKIRMEATPNYIYSLGTPQKIKSSLRQVKLIFILREPVSRLISWYRFAKQNGELSEQVTFDEYVQQQLQDSDNLPKVNQHLCALEQGRYSVYLQPYFDLFGKDKVHIAFYEELSKNPMLVMKQICLFADIDPNFYTNYEFKIFNRTETMQVPKLHQAYMNFRFRIRQYTHNQAMLHTSLRKIRLLLEPLYFKMNTRKSEKFVISPSIKAFLDEYYIKEANTLSDLLGRDITW
ncbi:MAG: sulfotransferase domain-containing protein [Phormidium sp.]